MLAKPGQSSARPVGGAQGVAGPMAGGSADPRAGGALETSLLTAAIEASSAAISIADMRDRDRPLIYANTAFEQATGYSAAEVIGKNCRFLQGEATDRDTVEIMRRAFRDRQSVKVDILNYRKSGEPFWNQLHLSPVLAPCGELSAYIGVQHDITEARKARIAQQHRHRIEALGRMAGGMAHEINNLLQPMLTLPDLIADDLAPGANRSRADLACITESARQAKGIVGEILAYTRVQTGCDISAAIAPAVRGALQILACGRAAHREIRTDIAVDDSVQAAGLSEGALKQILTNLVLNAVDAMPEGGAVDVSVRLHEDGIQLRVADEGVGMTPDILSRVCEPFFTTKPVGAGTGLGLYVVHDLVSRAGGRVEVSSEPGAGTQFTITLAPAGRA